MALFSGLLLLLALLPGELLHERATWGGVTAFLAATALTELAGRTNVFAMMEPFLPRLLERSGIRFQRAGADTDYHGIRAPYFVRTQDAVANMRPELTELYQSINTRIRSQFGQGLRAAS